MVDPRFCCFYIEAISSIVESNNEFLKPPVLFVTWKNFENSSPDTIALIIETITRILSDHTDTRVASSISEGKIVNNQLSISF